MSKFALFAEATTEYGDSTRLVGFTTSESVANSWAKREWCINDEDEDSGYSGTTQSESRKAVQVPDEPLLLQKDDWHPHDGNGYSQDESVVTYKQYVHYRRLLKSQIERRNRQYPKDMRMLLERDLEGLEYGFNATIWRDHRHGGRRILSVEPMLVVGNRFELEPWPQSFRILMRR